MSSCFRMHSHAGAWERGRNVISDSLAPAWESVLTLYVVMLPYAFPRGSVGMRTQCYFWLPCSRVGICTDFVCRHASVCIPTRERGNEDAMLFLIPLLPRGN